ncbi:prepilin-type N-terminal cleavage/methylation domain-containing protein [uncultured Thiothrix sp.]|uniref:pilin n=1 Tax=uncultured Thiothrix sp. TaxID=223185 RepID=UPI00260950C5|nr:pilin [uncultured Thiothrix sp.]
MQKNKNKLQQGFTLIELMIVVSIIGILAAIAIPSYQFFTIRAKLVEILRFSDSAKTYLWEEYSTNAYMPDEGTTTAQMVTDMMLTSDHVATAIYTKIDADNSNLEVTFKGLGSGADGKSIIFLLSTDKIRMEMDCSQGTLADFYRPSSCRSHL